jgi:pimeloyl-ACP methyl ester carboxylesterase
MDPLRRKILEAGAAAAAMATASRVLAQAGPAEGQMTFYERGPVRIHYEVAGSGFPLMLIAGGGLNSTLSGLKNGSPFNRSTSSRASIAASLQTCATRMAGNRPARSRIDRPWDAYTDDHIGLMDHLKIDKFMVLGFCIGGPSSGT